ncbi:MAG TPA: PDZ domain-containing protein [Solirubrobacteraceae bacterium]
MGSPRHLWSGDWQLESAAAAEELARRRAQAPPTEPDEPDPPAPRRPRRRRAIRVPGWRPRARTVRIGAIVAAVALLCAGAALGVSALVGGSGSASPPAVSADASALLGMKVTTLPVGGVLITSVAPNGPAYRAGLRRGDVITEVAEQRVESPDDIDSAITPLAPGSRVKIEFDRGAGTYLTQATLRKHPAGSP